MPKHLLVVDTNYSGLRLHISTPEGVIQCERADPHGVLVALAGQFFSIRKEDLPAIAEFFAAAAVGLDVDLNPPDGRLSLKGFPGAY